MKNTGYFYAVTRTHFRSIKLLKSEDIRNIRNAESLDDIFAILKNKGWGDGTIPTGDFAGLFAYENKQTWEFITKTLKEESPAFNVLRYKDDYNNLKAAIKLEYSGVPKEEHEKYFMPNGTIAPETITKAIAERDFSKLPEDMAETAEQAIEILAHTGSGQNCDAVIDKAGTEKIYSFGKSLEIDFFDRYVTLIADRANIKTAVRGSQMGKTREFFEMALAEAGSLDIEALTAAASAGTEEVYNYLLTTEYKGQVDKIQKSLTAFEAWSDNEIIKLIRPYRMANDGVEPLIAFIIGRETEIKLVKLIISAKINGFSPDEVNLRMRDLYV